MNKMLAIVAVIALCCLGAIARADVSKMATGLTSLETVNIGDADNAADTRFADPGYGAVSRDYSIGKYEVTCAQYAEFLNAVARTDTYGLYNPNMWTDNRGCKIQRSGDSGSYAYGVDLDWANRPVNFVSFWDACRFANWLHNGQPTGIQDASTTERGAYTLDGINGATEESVQRNADARWFLPTEDEWYKAAYYKGGSSDAGYWTYATRSDEIPSNAVDPTGGNNANFYLAWQYSIADPYFRTEAGTFTASPGPYGTYDQTGNVSEWTQDFAAQDDFRRPVSGGSFYDYEERIAASYRLLRYPAGETFLTGFRVAGAVPEPSSIAALAASLGGLLAIRRRKP